MATWEMTKTYGGNRKCSYCGRKMSTYTNGNFCNVHMTVGRALKEQEDEEKYLTKLSKQRASQIKKYKRKAQENANQ